MVGKITKRSLFVADIPQDQLELRSNRRQFPLQLLHLQIPLEGK